MNLRRGLLDRFEFSRQRQNNMINSRFREISRRENAEFDSRLSLSGFNTSGYFNFGRVRGGYNYYIPPGQSVTYPVTAYGAPGSAASTDPADLNAFTGTSTIEIG